MYNFEKSLDESKFSQLMTAVNILDDRVDSLQDGLKCQFEGFTMEIREGIVTLMNVVKALSDQVCELTKPAPAKDSIESKKVIHTKEAAQYLGCKVETICSYIAKGKLDARKFGRSYLIETKSFIAFVNGMNEKKPKGKRCAYW